MKRKIIILTPVRDEAWILERFLLAASEVADHILILDQKSEDESREICSRFAKVVMLENPSGDYSEAARSRLMLQEARARFGHSNVLIALDADEIITGDSLCAGSWEIFRELEPGTALYFEKPEMLPHPPRCVRQTCWFPLGLVDDGAPHQGKLIHSHRLPNRVDAPRYQAADIVVMHFARLRSIEYAVRQAYYCMVENVKCTKTHRIRNSVYSPHSFLRYGEDVSEPCAPVWFEWFSQHGVDLWSYRTERFNTFHKRALKLFAEHGLRRFYWDDIWWEDWEAARLHFIGRGVPGLPGQPLRSPPVMMRSLTTCLVWLYSLATFVAVFLRRLNGARQKVIHV